MSTYDFAAQRLFVEAPLHADARVAPTPAAQNYLLNVLRLRAGDPLLLFNGRDGEWRSRIELASRRAATLVVEERSRAQTAAGDLEYAFAPLKHARLDYMVQKAAEMGVARLIPVLTRRTQVRRVNLERMRANVIEAAEQCGLLNVPEILEARDLGDWLATLPAGRLLIFCDEDAEVANPIAMLRREAETRSEQGDAARATLLIGPEGGFDEAERARILGGPNVLRLSLGPRVLRADTAAVAALALVQSVLGDWQ
ncbi:MAG: 16S rRNA (uracil(1498)-N(3))-methyltransferase [Methylocystis sp.]